MLTDASTGGLLYGNKSNDISSYFLLIMQREQFCHSEDDIRTKVVYDWLANHGFTPNDISIEFSFEIRLGRGIYRVDGSPVKQSVHDATFRPRADAVVRFIDGRNLMVIEVKAPNETLDENVREQGISYARLLRQGGIAPYVVLTNGKETQIYDSYSGDLISSTSIPIDHCHAKAGYKVSGNDLLLRSQALETFISLNEENLIRFCKAQVAYRMRPLRDEDPLSGKKYVPSLYVERQKAKKELTKLLNDGKHNVIVVTGSPQVGKTNFLCHTVEEKLNAGLPCLFYPAIRMGRGLLDEIKEDFEWHLGDNSSAYHIIHRKLASILEKTGRHLYIFIDGLNEPNLSLVHDIDRDCERLANEKIIAIVSFINTTAPRLLIDPSGNPAYIAQAASINRQSLELISISPEKLKDAAIVSLAEYSQAETDETYKKYAQAFGVIVPNTHEYSNDPFLIRIGMHHFRGQILPNTFDEPALMATFIKEKIARISSGDISTSSIPSLLIKLGNCLFLENRSISWDVAAQLWGIQIIDFPEQLFDAALLANVNDSLGLPTVSFYNERERDFVIAYWARKWPESLKDLERLISEFSLADETPAGAGALRWFLKNDSTTLRLAAEKLPLFKKATLRRTILSTLWKTVDNYHYKEDAWIIEAVRRGAADIDPLVKAESAKLIAVITEDHDELSAIISEDRALVESILTIEEEYPLGENSVGHVVLDAFRALHWSLILDDDEASSPITDVLEQLINHDSVTTCVAAIKTIGYSSPNLLLKIIPKYLNTSAKFRLPLEKGLDIALGQLNEIYYGSMCPGYLHSLSDEPEQLAHEYEKMCQLCQPVISLLYPSKGSKALLSILDSLQPKNYFEKDLEDSLLTTADILAKRFQLPLPFLENTESYSVYDIAKCTTTDK